MRHIVGVCERLTDLTVRRDAPVVKHPGHITVNRRGLPFLHDQGPVQTPVYLFRALKVRVIPIRAGIDCVEFVDETLSRLDRALRQIWHTIHCVWHSQTVPVHGGGYG